MSNALFVNRITKRPTRCSRDPKRTKGKKEKKKRKRRRRKENARLWFNFVRRAYVGSRDENDLREEFGRG